MSDGSFLSALRFFRPKGDPSACREEKTDDGWAQTRCGQREWEDLYRRRWQYDKKVRSTHGVNCTGSCSWDVYVKDGILVWETQATDYPACGEGYPNHEPRGCPRGATYSWYTYSDTLTMLTLFRGGEAIWINDEDAQRIAVRDNDWLECFNANGVVMAKAVVSPRIPPGKAFC